jgi:hypothetical protein
MPATAKGGGAMALRGRADPFAGLAIECVEPALIAELERRRVSERFADSP